MSALDTREIVLGLLHRLRILAPVIALLWLFGIDLDIGVRLLLVPAVLLVLVLDAAAGNTPHTATTWAKPGGNLR
jgi:hypothetical protein